MRETFESWARAEISRLRTEADTLQRALDKYLESQEIKPVARAHLNGGFIGVVKRRAATVRARKGSKREFVLARIGESVGGATTGEVFDAVRLQFPDMKRSSLRALLYLEAKTGNIEKRGDRYVSKQDRPSAPTPDLSV
jgi:hypothetical protein